jgi:hypothetical protein
MSGASAKREIGTGDKSASSGRTHSRESTHKHKEESSSSIKSQWKGDKKKKMKEVVYYETDSSSPSTSGSESASATSKRHERKKYSKMPLRYPRISKRTLLLSVPLGKPPMFDGEDYSMWSDKMRHHLTSLHKSVWDIVEYGAQVPKEGDKDYDSEEVEQIQHFNSQATTILLASLSRMNKEMVPVAKIMIRRRSNKSNTSTPKQQKEKLNELISAIHEKDELLDSQEDFLIKENKKHVKVKNAYALKVEKCEKLTSELSTCHDTISSLRNENAKLIAKVEKSNVCDDSIVNLRNDNANLIAKIEKLNASLSSLKIENEKLIAKAKDLNVYNASISNLRDENAILHAKIVELNTCKPSTSTVEHVTICTRCRDINVDVIHDHLTLIKKQNDHIAQLSAKINEHDLENEKFKFARSMLYSGRRPDIKDGIGFQKVDNVKLNAPPKTLSNFVKGKAPMPQDNELHFVPCQLSRAQN